MKDLEDEIDKETSDLDIAEERSIKERAFNGETDSDYFEKVRHRAYMLWQSDGEPHGRDQDYWFRAEREIAEEEGEPAPSEARILP